MTIKIEDLDGSLKEALKVAIAMMELKDYKTQAHIDKLSDLRERLSFDVDTWKTILSYPLFEATFSGRVRRIGTLDELRVFSMMVGPHAYSAVQLERTREDGGLDIEPRRVLDIINNTYPFGF